MPKSVFTAAYTILREQVVAQRREAGVSQVELAARLGVSQSFISQIERGVRRLDLIEFYALMKALKADPVAVFAAIAQHLPERIALSGND